MRFATRGADANARTLEMDCDAESMASKCDVVGVNFRFLGARGGAAALQEGDYCCGCERMNTTGLTVGDSGCD